MRGRKYAFRHCLMEKEGLDRKEVVLGYLTLGVWLENIDKLIIIVEVILTRLCARVDNFSKVVNSLLSALTLNFRLKFWS